MSEPSEPPPPLRPNRYSQIIERIFFKGYQEGVREVQFSRDDMIQAAQELQIALPKNIGDVLYSFRYRGVLPDSIRAKAPVGEEWVIRSVGRSLYRFVAMRPTPLVPNPNLIEIKLPDATPGIVIKYAQGDEQALLARVRYNRLIDIFTGVTSYSLQSHLRTTAPDVGQIETDEIYVGVNKQGAQFVLPVQAKGKTDRLGVVQIEQDFVLCEDRFPDLICRPIAAQFMTEGVIALFSFVRQDGAVRILDEKHYRLVPSANITSAELATYRGATDEQTDER